MLINSPLASFIHKYPPFSCMSSLRKPSKSRTGTFFEKITYWQSSMAMMLPSQVDVNPHLDCASCKFSIHITSCPFISRHNFCAGVYRPTCKYVYLLAKVDGEDFFLHLLQSTISALEAIRCLWLQSIQTIAVPITVSQIVKMKTLLVDFPIEVSRMSSFVSRNRWQALD